jgi:uncharacterized protein (DUF924 family)
MNYKDQDIFDFWFSNEVKVKWFAKDVNFDQEIRDKFEIYYEAAKTGILDSWENSPLGTLALIIILDQFPRNMFRGTDLSFATDYLALAHTKKAIEKNFGAELTKEQKQFLYMPLMHSENLENQMLSVELFSRLHENNEFAIKHMEIIKRFGRFPHRNDILKRKSTDEEITFLSGPNSSF